MSVGKVARSVGVSPQSVRGLELGWSEPALATVVSVAAAAGRQLRLVDTIGAGYPQRRRAGRARAGAACAGPVRHARRVARARGPDRRLTDRSSR